MTADGWGYPAAEGADRRPDPADYDASKPCTGHRPRSGQLMTAHTSPAAEMLPPPRTAGERDMKGLAATAMLRRGTKPDKRHGDGYRSGRASTSVAMTVAIYAVFAMASLRRDCYRSPWQGPMTDKTRSAWRKILATLTGGKATDDDDTSVQCAPRWRAVCEPVGLTGGCRRQPWATDGGDRESFRRAGFGRRQCGFRVRRRRRSAVMSPSTRGPGASSACTR